MVSCVFKLRFSDVQGVVRGCVPAAMNDGCIQDDYEGVHASICYCRGNLCNGVQSAASYTMLLLLLPCFMLLQGVITKE